MFVYTGKLNWQSEAVNEVFVVVLPSGPVRLGDRIFTFSQWTHDSKGNKKVTWCQDQIIDKVTRENNGDDSFHFGAGWYKYQVLASDNYQTLSIKMYHGTYSRTMEVQRMYLTAGDASDGSARLWAGRLNWPQYADNEPILVIVPSGFGVGRPVLAFWQWTTDQNNQQKVNCAHTGTQTTENPSEGSLTFTATAHDDTKAAAEYLLTCTWNEKTEKLAVHMAGAADANGQDIGPLDLMAHFEAHSHEINPPKLPGEKVELEVFYPQAEQALPRVRSALPFPPTLLDTLAHTAAYVDQAGYLAKYAVDRYHTLDKSYHALREQVDDLNEQNRNMSDKVSALTDESSREKQQIGDLQKQLTETLDDAAAKQAELISQIQDLQKKLAKEQAHDAEDEKALDAAHEQIKADQAVQAALKKQVAALQLALNEGARRLDQLQAQVNKLSQENGELRGQLAAETADNAALRMAADGLKSTVAALQGEVSGLQKALDNAAEKVRELQSECDNKDGIIEGLENGLEAAKKDRDAWKAKYKALQESTDATIRDLNNEIAQLKIQLAAARAGGGGGAGGDDWPFPNGWPFHKNGNNGGCWPPPDEVIKQALSGTRAF
ncbi:hypothetical protein C7999DRAFT_33571 [Corynascus novoguineensis]|uniref:Uncharacterized protein n=1 Tax=Corynascus novoguineensis TaxID=1126955 RepID=A0AAN7HDL2_9PEZI|nr:hypothetical protein C7999DRAFT_33571 [Corynascus novoguineensis]